MIGAAQRSGHLNGVIVFLLSEAPRHSSQSPLPGRDVGSVGSAYSAGDCGVGERCDRTCCDGCGYCELSGSAVHAEEWDTRD
jgi:hypothetical protein